MKDYNATAIRLWGDFSTQDMVELWNSYTEETNQMDNYIFPMCEFNELMEGKEPWEIARAIHFGKFNPCNEYFWFNAYGNLESGNYCEYLNNGYGWLNDLAIYPEEIVEWYQTNKED